MRQNPCFCTLLHGITALRQGTKNVTCHILSEKELKDRIGSADDQEKTACRRDPEAAGSD